ncbi:LUD domain-containing protein [Hymenobacter sp.]|uniref:LutC/YkgG family protein n=1 Tax=Hymenobacter sp. TaxID=1898978 RepID=UPI00286A4E0C|nr:LUD domain-containing protein [Hymenobacter sp.]
MSATTRATILAAVRGAQPAQTPLPAVPHFSGDASVEKFSTLLASIGGQVVTLPEPARLAETVARLYPNELRVASALIPATVLVGAGTPTTVLATVDLAVLRGELGVAENGAVWLPEVNMLHRALPTIAQHLVLVLDRANLVATMHQAYARRPVLDGYGVFLAGPSKTADIEQSLVIGAHGARSLTVIIE